MNWPYWPGWIRPDWRNSRVMTAGVRDGSNASSFRSSNQAVPVPLP